MAEVTENQLQIQIDEINHKLDIIIEEVYAQKAARQSVEDLVDDVSIIGKDIFKHTVTELDHAGIEIDRDALAGIGIKLIRNIGTINELLDTLESVNDLVKDVSPILHQAGLDAVHKMAELEHKGYFEFLRELGWMADNIVMHFSREDVRALSENIVIILETLKNLTQPDILKAINNAVSVYKNLDMEDIQEYSLLRAMRELRKPEMRRGIGFMITFLKKLNESK